jgi:hypothetical protein
VGAPPPTPYFPPFHPKRRGVGVPVVRRPTVTDRRITETPDTTTPGPAVPDRPSPPRDRFRGVCTPLLDPTDPSLLFHPEHCRYRSDRRTPEPYGQSTPTERDDHRTTVEQSSRSGRSPPEHEVLSAGIGGHPSRSDRPVPSGITAAPPRDPRRALRTDDRETARVRPERVGASYRRSTGSRDHGRRAAAAEPTPPHGPVRGRIALIASPSSASAASTGPRGLGPRCDSGPFGADGRIQGLDGRTSR